MLDESALAEVTQELSAANATVLMDELTAHFEADDQVSVTDLGNVFMNHGYYAYELKTDFIQQLMVDIREVLPPNHRFTTYGDYAWNGFLWQQCQSANFLAMDYVNWYAEIAEAPIQAQPIFGFVDTEQQGFVGGAGHQTTLVTHTELPRTYTLIDATPINLDPDAEQNQQSPNPQAQQMPPPPEPVETPAEEEPVAPPEPQEPRIVGVLPRRIEVVTEVSAPTPENENTSEAEEQQAPDIRVGAYERLSQLANQLGQAIEAEAAGNPDIRRNPEMLRAEGINIAAYTNVVRQLMAREITAEVALMRLQARASNYRDFQSIGTNRGDAQYTESLRDYFTAILDSDPENNYGALYRNIFTEYRVRLRAFQVHIENDVRTRGDSVYSFLLGPELRNPIEELVTTLERLDYQTLLSDEQIFWAEEQDTGEHSTADCVDALK